MFVVLLLIGLLALSNAAYVPLSSTDEPPTTPDTFKYPCSPPFRQPPEVTIIYTRCIPHCPQRSSLNDTLYMNYNGSLASNGSLFDSSYSPESPWPAGDPFSFVLGVGQVIKGFDAGTYGMCPGERRTLIIPGQYGYGSKGIPDVIPPNATLLFDIEFMRFGEASAERRALVRKSLRRSRRVSSPPGIWWLPSK